MNKMNVMTAEERFALNSYLNHARTDRMFTTLMVLQWLGGILMAYAFGTESWDGTVPAVHPHVWAAIVGGGLLASLPIYLALCSPGQQLTRFVIACSQVLFSSLLIHVSGGRIETHFHIFGSLAFLAAYRDWKVLVPASAIVAIDHLAR